MDASAGLDACPVEPQAPAAPWQSHPVDVPLSVGGFYFRLVIGRERRSKERRKRDREAQQLGTIGNMLFAGSISGIVFSVLIVVILVYSSILSE
jgi:hypothetical protein